MDTKDFAYASGIVLTFVLGLWNLILNWRVARRTTFINTVTSQRIKWIEELRQDISTFSGLTHTWCFSALEGTPQEHDVLKEIDRLRHVIRLRLNPAGIHDREIEVLINRIPRLTNIVDREPLVQALDDLTATAQKLIKEEWEKVKDETEKGRLS